MSRQESSLLEWARSLPLQPQVPVFQPREHDDHLAFDGMDDEFSGIRSQGLPEAEIDSLPSYIFNPEAHEPEPVPCVVCVSHMESEDLVRVLPCMHKFHATCIDNWLRQNPTCPLCRQDVSLAGPSTLETN